MARTSRSRCPVACTLDLVGDRWTLVIYRDLTAGKRRFDDFLGSPERIATNVLAERLRRLEDEELIEAEPDPADARRKLYRLTRRGRSLGPVMAAMRDWGLRHLKGTSLADYRKMARRYRAAI